jgi:hypothetical protein
VRDVGLGRTGRRRTGRVGVFGRTRRGRQRVHVGLGELQRIEHRLGIRRRIRVGHQRIRERLQQLGIGIERIGDELERVG